MKKVKSKFLKVASYYILYFFCIIIFSNCEEKKVKESMRFPTKKEMNMDYLEQIRILKELDSDAIDKTLYDYQLAHLYFLNGDYENSEKHIKNNLTTGSTHGASYALAVQLYFQQNDFEKASQYVNTAINLGVKTADIFFLKSLIHYNFQEFDSALLNIDKALNKRKTSEMIFHKVQVLLQKDDTTTIRSMISPLIENDSTNQKYKIILFELENRAQHYQTALKHIQDMIEITATSNRDLILKLADTYEKLGDIRKTFFVLEEYFEQNRDDLALGKILGEKYLSINFLKNANLIYQKMKLTDSLSNDTQNLLIQIIQYNQ